MGWIITSKLRLRSWMALSFFSSLELGSTRVSIHVWKVWWLNSLDWVEDVVAVADPIVPPDGTGKLAMFLPFFVDKLMFFDYLYNIFQMTLYIKLIVITISSIMYDQWTDIVFEI